MRERPQNLTKLLRSLPPFLVTFPQTLSSYIRMAETDENLMLAVRDGEVSKLGTLFDRHHRGLFDFFARLTGSRTLAEDLGQDVSFRILKYRQTFRADSHFKAWMFHIARNARFDHFKKHQPETPLPEDGMGALPSRAAAPGHGLEQEQQTVLLECAMFKL